MIHPDDVAHGTPATIVDTLGDERTPARVIDVFRDDNGRITEAIVEDETTGDRLLFQWRLDPEYPVRLWGHTYALRHGEWDRLEIGQRPEVNE